MQIILKFADESLYQRNSYLIISTLMKRKYLLNYMLLGLVGVLIFCLSDYIRWYGDALLYRFNFATGEPVESAQDIITSQYTHYFVMNGRIWVHVLCQAFSALWGQTAFAVCNGAMYIIFILLFAKICQLDWRRTENLLICILVVLFFCDTSYIANCQIGYVWTSAVTLAFIILYNKSRNVNRRVSFLRQVLLFILSLAAGNGNEAIAIGVGAALIVDFFTNFRRLTATQWAMLTGFGLGGLLLCLSPGILKRASSDSANVIWSVYRLLGYSRMLYLLVITLVVLKIRRKIRLREFIMENLFFSTALLTLLIFNIAIGIGELSGRQLFGVELFSAILTVRALRDVQLPKLIISVFAVVVAALYVMKFDYLQKSNDDLAVLRKSLSETADMKVYIDFQRYPALVHPTEHRNNYELYVFVASSIYDDLSGFGHYYYNHKTRNAHPPYHDKLAIYPTVMKELLSASDRNFAGKMADGLYLVVQDTARPKRFLLNRELNILGITRPRDPYDIEFVNRFYLDMDSVKVVYSDFITPMIENREITITE